MEEIDNGIFLAKFYTIKAGRKIAEVYNIIKNLLDGSIIVNHNFIKEKTLVNSHSRTDEDKNLYLSKPENSIDNAETESENLGK